MDHYILDGHQIVPVDLMTWAMWFENAMNSRIVAKTIIYEKEVSTVFLGLDHQFGDGPPLLFESMVFPECEECERYSTWDEATAGHERIVKRLEAEAQDAIR